MGKVHFSKSAYSEITGEVVYLSRSPFDNISGYYYPAADYEALQAELYELKQEIIDRNNAEKSLKQVVIDLDDELSEAKAEADRLRKAHNAVTGLIENSAGVFGLHLNGDVAPWETLQTGGQFEEWLIDFDKAALRNEVE